MWPIGHLTGVPLQRPPEFGDRRFLTDEELAARQQQYTGIQGAYEQEIDTNKMGMGHWVEWGKANRLTSLIIDPPNGQLPALTPEGERRRAADAQRLDDDPVRSLDRFRQLGPLHHARLASVDAARVLQQRRRDPSVAGLRRDPPRDDPRGARHPDQRASPSTPMPRPGSATRAAAGKATRSSSRRRTSTAKAARRTSTRSARRRSTTRRSARNTC